VVEAITKDQRVVEAITRGQGVKAVTQDQGMEAITRDQRVEAITQDLGMEDITTQSAAWEGTIAALASVMWARETVTDTVTADMVSSVGRITVHSVGTQMTIAATTLRTVMAARWAVPALVETAAALEAGNVVQGRETVTITLTVGKGFSVVTTTVLWDLAGSMMTTAAIIRIKVMVDSAWEETTVVLTVAVMWGKEIATTILIVNLVLNVATITAP